MTTSAWTFVQFFDWEPAALAPVLLGALLMWSTRGSNEALRSSGLVTYGLVLGTGVFVYLHWRMTGATPSRMNRQLAGWLTAGLVAASLQRLGQALLVDPTSERWRDPWPLVAQIVLLVALVVATRVAERADLRSDPALCGAIAGILLTAAGCIVVNVAEPLAASRTTTQLLNAIMLLTGILLAWTLWQRSQVSAWARHRLALAAFLLTLAQSIAHLDTHNRWVVALAVVVNFQGALVLCTISRSLLRHSVLEHQREVVRLQEVLAQARADVLEERELLHEVGSTVAGITSANRVMRHDRLLPHERRERLQQMFNAELARLDRLMTGRHMDPVRQFDLDDVVEPLVTSHQERGLAVQWTPNHLRVVGDPDDFAEVVNILLNARRHGGTSVRIEAFAGEGYAELRCSDDGPGIAREVHTQLFQSGARRNDSPGQGLGLSIAQRLMSERGGSLELADSDDNSVHPGATFVARLPMSEIAHANHHVA